MTTFLYECKTEGCDGRYPSPVPLVGVWCAKCATYAKATGTTKHPMVLVDTSEDEKVCTSCGEAKDADQFYKNQAKCKPCYRARYG